FSIFSETGLINGALRAITICRYNINPNAIISNAPIKLLISLNVSEPHSQNQIFEMKLPKLSLHPQAENPIESAVKRLIAMGMPKYFHSPSLLMRRKVPAYACMPFRMFCIIDLLFFQTCRFVYFLQGPKFMQPLFCNINKFVWILFCVFNSTDFLGFGSFLS